MRNLRRNTNGESGGRDEAYVDASVRPWQPHDNLLPGGGER